MAAHRVTLSDVARAAGVSVATASFVLAGRDGRPGGAPATRRKVLKAAQDLGYTPNQHARAMRTGRSGAIALALGDPRDPWVNELASTVAVRAEAVGLSTVVLVDETWDTFLRGHQFDCAFVTGSDATVHSRREAVELARQGATMVVLSSLATPEYFDVVSSSPVRAIGQAYELLRSRHERVHLLSTPWTFALEPPLRTRAQLFAETVERHGDDPSGLTVEVPGTMAEARRHAAEWLRGPDRPTAVVAQTAYLALALQAAAVQVGVTMPDDLEIISIGDVPQPTALFEPVSYFGATDVFTRIADAVVGRALTPDQRPFTRTVLEWVLHPGSTTR